MSDKKKPEELKARFRVISGGLDVGTLSSLPAKLEGKEFTLDDLDRWNLSFEFVDAGEQPDIKEIIIEGVTVYVERLEETPFEDTVLGDPLEDTFIFDTGPKLVR